EPLDVLDDVRPGLAAVARHLYVAVVGPDPDDVWIDQGRRDREDGAVELGRGVVDSDGSAGRLLLVLVIGREIRTDDLPRLAMRRRLEGYVAAEVDRLAVGPERNRRVPVVAVLVVLHGIADRADPVRIRRDRAFVAGPRINHADDASLEVGVDTPRLLE